MSYNPDELAAVRDDLEYHQVLHPEVQKALQDALQPWPCKRIYQIQEQYSWQEAIKAIAHFDKMFSTVWEDKTGYKSTVVTAQVMPQKNNYRIRKRNLK